MTVTSQTENITMVGSDALPAGVDAPMQIGTIDLDKYQTSDLAERLTELVSAPEAFRRILSATS